jgi:glucosamine--fructose-6-phosphate aminotransferase (isomerizing)
MCGIVGANSRDGDVVPFLVEGLRILEYRGYDSVGVGVLQSGGIALEKRAGRINELAEVLAESPLSGGIGIGHSRWATHGPPTDENAHPHMDQAGRVALCHNGIIENYAELRDELVAAGVEMRSETDTEVLAQLIGRELAQEDSLLEAVRRALSRVSGYYAIAALALTDEPQLVCAREGPPLCLGITEKASWLASDVLAILPHTRDILFLQDGDIAQLWPGSLEIRALDGSAVERELKTIEWDSEAADLEGWPHYMLKEIHEQPEVVARTTFERLDAERGDVLLDGELWSDASLRGIERIQILACGTAYHAGLVARYMIEGLAGLPVDVEMASEFRYRDPLLARNTLVLGISQSGETADTLAALRMAGEMGCPTATICNSIGSTMVRDCDATILIEAGPEIGVASTKAFVAMLVASYMLAVRAARARGAADAARGRQLIENLERVQTGLRTLLARSATQHVKEIARRYAGSKGFLFLGRWISYPIALEGALKLKEISYVHAEGYPAGEMKHGPIALIEPGMTTVVVAPDDRVAEKVRQNIEQVRARGGQVVCVGADEPSMELADETIVVPEVDAWLSPLLTVIPLQLFAYYVAKEKGCDIDKPRNLAKSVTVE